MDWGRISDNKEVDLSPPSSLSGWRQPVDQVCAPCLTAN